jgi:hypothetical protein
MACGHIDLRDWTLWAGLCVLPYLRSRRASLGEIFATKNGYRTRHLRRQYCGSSGGKAGIGARDRGQDNRGAPTMKRFILATETLSADQERALALQFPQPPWAWWHWLPNFWLLVDQSGQMTGDNVRDLFSAVSPAQCLVLEVDGRTWTGMFTTDMARRAAMETWIRSYWENNPPSTRLRQI